MYKFRKTLIVSVCLSFVMIIAEPLLLLHDKGTAQSIQNPEIYAVSNLGEVLDFKTIANLTRGEENRVVNSVQGQQLPEWFQFSQNIMDQLMPQTIIGPDDRVKVADTTFFPWATIVKIQGNFGATSFECSGWMLGVSTVATSAHCIYDYGNTNLFASNVSITPALNSDAANSTPFGSCQVSKAWIINLWQSTGDLQYDYGVLFADCRIGEQTGTLGYRVMTDAQLADELVNVTGYPADKGGTTMWFGLGHIVETEPQFLYYDNDTFSGQSGSPVWELINDSCQTCVVAIHSRGTIAGDKNRGIRITNDVFDFLFALKQQEYRSIYLPLVVK